VYTGIVGSELVAVFVGAPPLPVVEGVADRVALGVADCVALGVSDVLISEEGSALGDVGHGLALGEAVTGALASAPAEALSAELSPDVAEASGSAELESVAAAEADAVASVSEGAAEAESVAGSEAPAVDVLEQAGADESASAETGSTSEVP
jgi:hypothetical protein